MASRRDVHMKSCSMFPYSYGKTPL